MSHRILSIVLLCFCLSFEPHKANAQLTTYVELDQTGSVFSYTLFNNESSSQQYLNTFHLTVNAPITVTNTPEGWDFVTDNNTYVDWFSTDMAPPYSHDVAPGSSLGGFMITSTLNESRVEILAFAVTFWDHGNDISGPGIQDFIKVPSAESVISIFLPLVYYKAVTP